MDVVDRAIIKGFHQTNDRDLMKQRYEQFEHAMEGRRLFLYGAGNLMPLFWLRYHKSIPVHRIVDTSEDKIGKPLTGFTKIVNRDICCDTISGLEVLKNDDNKDSIVVLILSIRAYKDIYYQLGQIGLHNIFSMLLMEYNRRLDADELLAEHPDFLELFQEECRRMNPINNKVLFEMGIHGEHGMAITRALLRCGQELDILWRINDAGKKHPEGVRIFEGNDEIENEYEISSSHVFIYDVVELPKLFQNKKPGQVYIQAKHWSSVTLKKFALDDAKRISEEYFNKVLSCCKKTDYIIVGSKFDEDTCRQGFGGYAKLVKAGSPRSDILFDPLLGKRIKQNIIGDDQKYVLMYAPTFRSDKDERAQFFRTSLDSGKLREVLHSRFGGDWDLWIRRHPLLAKEKVANEFADWTDVSDHPDMEELVAAADIMITDYSSVMFEPAYVYKPVFLYAPDKESYVGGEKNLLLDYGSLPFPISVSNEELLDQIALFDETQYHKTVESFFEKHKVHEDGHASERAAVFIVSLVKEK